MLPNELGISRIPNAWKKGSISGTMAPLWWPTLFKRTWVIKNYSQLGRLRRTNAVIASRKSWDIRLECHCSYFPDTGIWCAWKWDILRFLHPWRRHQMETFSALLVICAGNSPVTGEFPAQRPVTRSFDVFFDMRLKKGWINNGDCVIWDATAPIMACL